MRVMLVVTVSTMIWCSQAWTQEMKVDSAPAVPTIAMLGSDHWAALNPDYLEGLVMSLESELSLQDWDSQVVISAKLAQLRRCVKALRFLRSERARTTMKALRILGASDANNADLKRVIEPELEEFSRIGEELEAALEPVEDDTDLD